MPQHKLLWACLRAWRRARPPTAPAHLPYPPMVQVRPTAQEAMPASLPYLISAGLACRLLRGGADVWGDCRRNTRSAAAARSKPGDFATQPPPKGHPGYAPGCGVPGNTAQPVRSSGSCGECCGDFLIRVIQKSDYFNIQWCGLPWHGLLARRLALAQVPVIDT